MMGRGLKALRRRRYKNAVSRFKIPAPSMTLNKSNQIGTNDKFKINPGDHPNFPLFTKQYHIFYFLQAFTKAEKSGCGLRGRARNSGWNWTPIKNGCLDLGNSQISIKCPSGDLPENTIPFFSKSGINFSLTSYR